MKWYWGLLHRYMYKHGKEVEYFKWQTWFMLPFYLWGCYAIATGIADWLVQRDIDNAVNRAEEFRIKNTY